MITHRLKNVHNISMKLFFLKGELNSPRYLDMSAGELPQVLSMTKNCFQITKLPLRVLNMTVNCYIGALFMSGEQCTFFMLERKRYQIQFIIFNRGLAKCQ
jgi:hypothetical protein